MVGPGRVILDEPVSSADAAGEEFEAAVQAHARSVYHIAYSVLRNHHDAEDAAQETFLKFLKCRDRWGEIRNQRAWLAQTTWRVALRLRQRPLEIALEDAMEMVLKLQAAGARTATKSRWTPR